MADLHLQSPATAQARTKPPPKQSSIPTPFVYHASDDGTDENLLVLLHGLGKSPSPASYSCAYTDTVTTTGDTHLPFARLGRQLKLPQTATLALRAPEQCASRPRTHI